MDGMETLNATTLPPLADVTDCASEPAALRAALGRDGYLFIRRLVPAKRVARLRRLVLDHARCVSWLDAAAGMDQARAATGIRVGDYQAPEWMALQERVQSSDELWAVGDAPDIHRVLTAAFGRPSFLFLGMNTCRVVSPHPELAARLHQDTHYVRLPDEFVTVWVPLGDCPVALGPLAVVPGSHRRGLLPHHGVGIVDGGVDVEDDVVWHSGDFACGDALVLSRLTIHRALPNLSGHTLRLSADLRYGFRNSDAG
ncbi:MAG: phytanoyl-CoA dioxygenase family protein [Ideonella sp.]|nr:phytanoyl-CoA dioxygenase family protein [Ideonella sp.]